MPEAEKPMSEVIVVPGPFTEEERAALRTAWEQELQDTHCYPIVGAPLPSWWYRLCRWWRTHAR